MAQLPAGIEVSVSIREDQRGQEPEERYNPCDVLGDDDEPTYATGGVVPHAASRVVAANTGVAEAVSRLETIREEAKKLGGRPLSVSPLVYRLLENQEKLESQLQYEINSRQSQIRATQRLQEQLDRLGKVLSEKNDRILSLERARAKSRPYPEATLRDLRADNRKAWDEVGHLRERLQKAKEANMTLQEKQNKILAVLGGVG